MTTRSAEHLSFFTPEIAGRFEQPVHMSSEALGRLEGWGFTDDQVTELLEMTGEFHYDNCIEKAKRIAQKGALIDPMSGLMVLPDFYDFPGKLQDGNCADINLKFAKRLYNSKLLTNVSELRGTANQPPLTLYTADGWADEFFMRGSMHHYAVITPIGYPQDLLVVDASLRRITVPKPDGYRINELAAPIEIMEPVCGIPVAGRRGYHNNTWARQPILETLGATADFSHVLSVGFELRDSFVHPIIEMLNKQGKALQFMFGADGLLYKAIPQVQPSPQNIAEITQILKILWTTPFTIDSELTLIMANKKNRRKVLGTIGRRE